MSSILFRCFLPLPLSSLSLSPAPPLSSPALPTLLLASIFNVYTHRGWGRDGKGEVSPYHRKTNPSFLFSNPFFVFFFFPIFSSLFLLNVSVPFLLVCQLTALTLALTLTSLYNKSGIRYRTMQSLIRSSQRSLCIAHKASPLVRSFSRKAKNLSPEEAAALLRAKRRDLASDQRDTAGKREALSARVLFNLGSSGLMGEEEDVLVRRRPEHHTFVPVDTTDVHVESLEAQKKALFQLESLEQSRKRVEMRPVYYRNVDSLGRARGKGMRKSARANVILRPGTGKLTVNGKSHVDYFPRVDHRLQVFAPFYVTDTQLQFDVEAFTTGGGHTGKWSYWGGLSLFL